jgi:hypothetical protein
MECKRNQFDKHVSEITSILLKECQISKPQPLVTCENFQIKIRNGPTPPFRQVTTEFDFLEYALELPVSSQRHRRKYWVAFHEGWSAVGTHRIRFRQCSLRLYVSMAKEEPMQFLRLEWIAPDEAGEYDGKHAGHPHWHVDRAVLASSKVFAQSLEAPTNEVGQLVVEEFGPLTEPSTDLVQGENALADYSWMQKIHLPAQAGWIKKWDGTQIPGPHQSEPDDFRALENWWAGSLRYFVQELSSLRF